jgi:hypothetical protein
MDKKCRLKNITDCEPNTYAGLFMSQPYFAAAKMVNATGDLMSIQNGKRPEQGASGGIRELSTPPSKLHRK